MSGPHLQAKMATNKLSFSFTKKVIAINFEWSVEWLMKSLKELDILKHLASEMGGAIHLQLLISREEMGQGWG